MRKLVFLRVRNFPWELLSKRPTPIILICKNCSHNVHHHLVRGRIYKCKEREFFEGFSRFSYCMDLFRPIMSRPLGFLDVGQKVQPRHAPNGSNVGSGLSCTMFNLFAIIFWPTFNLSGL